MKNFSLSSCLGRVTLKKGLLSGLGNWKYPSNFPLSFRF